MYYFIPHPVLEWITIAVTWFAVPVLYWQILRMDRRVRRLESWKRWKESEQ